MVPEENGELLTERYRFRSDEELMDDALLYDRLVPAAQAAIRAEFERRSLEPPMVYGEGEGRPIQLVTIARYRDLSEGIVARAALESAGIECFLMDENFVRLDWGYSNFIGGMRLQVDALDEDEAKRILQQDTPEEIDVPGQPPFVKPICPRCGSDSVIAYDAGLKPAAVVLLLTNFLSAFLLWPLMLWRVLKKQPKRKGAEGWHCLNSGCNWTEED